MNKGQKVFDGPLSSIGQSKNWVKLRVDDFVETVKVLTREKLIVEHRDGNLISLADHTQTDRVVRCLVQNNISVFEISPQEQTLEHFYLSLMQSKNENSGNDQVAAARVNNSRTN
jgi:ABC-type uncharacterized transport system ATPase subunit